LLPLGHWLRRHGFYASRSGIGLNVGCALELVRRLERVAGGMVEHRGRRLVVIGQSRGGALAKILAIRRPDLVRGIVTLGSPNVAPAAIHPLVAGAAGVLRTLSRVGVPGLLDDECWSGACAATVWREMSGPFPGGVSYVSIYSRRDGIVDWRACLDPAAEHVEVRSSHVGMAVNADVYRVLADVLARAAGTSGG
jgi:pimeloyl-ACP methyl ester carboxylesterase